MPSDPIAAYQAALDEFDVATAAAERLNEQANDVARAMQRWRELTIADWEPPSPFPIEATVFISTREWPSADQAAAALSRWRQARKAAQDAFRAIPPAQRGVVKEPPCECE